MKKTKMKKILYTLIIGFLLLGSGNFLHLDFREEVFAEQSDEFDYENLPVIEFLRTNQFTSPLFNFGVKANIGIRKNFGIIDAQEAKEEEERYITSKIPPKKCFNSINPTSFFGFDMEGCVSEVSYILLWIAARFLWIAGWFFNATLVYSLNFGLLLKAVPIVDIGWKILRDVANLCFIFILLYIAINTILQTKSADTKRLLIRVIIVAILLNFSLFFAKVVIDSSNILALQFYEKMSTGSDGDDRKAYDKGISQTFIKNLGLESVYKAGGGDSSATGVEPIPNIRNTIVIMIGGALMILVTAFVFFAGAIMFIIRTIVLIFLLVLSPLAFLSMILPQTESHWKKWSGMLLSQSFFAPIYMIMMYIVISIVSTGSFSTPSGTPTNIASFLSGNASSVGTIYVYLILIALMLGSLFVAKSLGAVGGDFARNMAGKATFGASSWMGRRSAGYIGSKLAENKWVNNLANNRRAGIIGSMGRGIGMATKKTGDVAAKGSYDIRGIAGVDALTSTFGGVGKAVGEGGYAKIKDDKKKEKTEFERARAIQHKKMDLQNALKNPSNEAAIQEALYKFSDTEYGELGGDILTNSVVVRNAKPSQILSVTDEKFEKLRVDQKKSIKEMRSGQVLGAAGANLNHATPEAANDITRRYNALSPEAKAKLSTNGTYGGVWAPVIAHMVNNPEDGAGLQGLMAGLPTPARDELLSQIKTANVKGELNKLSSEEKSKMDVSTLIDPNNEDLLRNLDSDTLKAIAERKDVPPVERDKVKNRRHELLVDDLNRGNESKAGDLLKGMKESDLLKLIADPRVGTGNVTFAKLLTVGQIQDLEKAEISSVDKSRLGAVIGNPTHGARGLSYVRSQRGIDNGWT